MDLLRDAYDRPGHAEGSRPDFYYGGLANWRAYFGNCKNSSFLLRPPVAILTNSSVYMQRPESRAVEYSGDGVNPGLACLWIPMPLNVFKDPNYTFVQLVVELDAASPPFYVPPDNSQVMVYFSDVSPDTQSQNNLTFAWVPQHETNGVHRDMSQNYIQAVCAGKPRLSEAPFSPSPSDEWHHLKAVVDLKKKEARWYVNDALAATLDVSDLPPAAFTCFAVGFDADAVGTKEGFSEAVDNIRVYGVYSPPPEPGTVAVFIGVGIMSVFAVVFGIFGGKFWRWMRS